MVNKEKFPEEIPEFTLEDIIKEFGSGEFDLDTPADSLGDTQVFSPVTPEDIEAAQEAPAVEEVPVEVEEIPAEEEDVPAEAEETVKLPKIATVYSENEGIEYRENGIIKIGCNTYDISGADYVCGNTFDIKPSKISLSSISFKFSKDAVSKNLYIIILKPKISNSDTNKIGRAHV